jgi:hypothetical protein
VTRALAFAALALLLAAGARAASSGSVTGTVIVNPLEVSLALTHAQVPVGQYSAATATVRNLGAAPLTGVTATLRLDPGLTVAGSPTRSLAPLAGGASANVAWTLCAAVPGNYFVLATARIGSVSADSAAQLLQVPAGPGSCPATIPATVGICQLTKQFIQSSAQYQALPRALRRAADTLANALCDGLAQIVPGLTPTQKAAAVNLYKLGVQALVTAGWITQSQADTLKTLADGL